MFIAANNMHGAAEILFGPAEIMCGVADIAHGREKFAFTRAPIIIPTSPQCLVFKNYPFKRLRKCIKLPSNLSTSSPIQVFHGQILNQPVAARRVLCHAVNCQNQPITAKQLFNQPITSQHLGLTLWSQVSQNI